MSQMSIFWVDTESGALLIKRFNQSDGMPLPEDTVMGGIDTQNGYSLGWGKIAGQKRELILRNHPITAKIDVEKYMVFHGTMDSIITVPAPPPGYQI